MTTRYVPTKQTPLEQRISAMLANTNATAATLTALLAETDSAITAMEASVARLKFDAYDPQKHPDPQVARQQLEDSEFALGRLQTLRPRLQQRLQVVEAAEQHDQWLADYAALRIKRDEVAGELREAYPAAEHIATVLAKSVALDAELSALHQSRPAGEPLHLDGAELVARDMTEFTRDKPSLVKTLVLPAWNGGGNLWPIKQHIDPALYGIHDGRRFADDCGPNWWKPGAAAAQDRARQEQEEIAKTEIEKDRFYGRQP